MCILITINLNDTPLLKLFMIAFCLDLKLKQQFKYYFVDMKICPFKKVSLRIL